MPAEPAAARTGPAAPAAPPRTPPLPPASAWAAPDPEPAPPLPPASAWPAWPAWPPVDADLLQAVSAVVASGRWSGVDAPDVVAFEREWAGFLGVAHAVTCSTGTTALVLALRALGVGSGDQVVVPAFTFLATASAVLEVGALPVFADIDPATYCLDPDAAAAAVTDRTRAVVAVHLAGRPADLDRLAALCAAYGLALVEDAAQAHGAAWRGRRVGGFGSFGCWSFQASKNLTSGEGGALTTGDARLAELAASLRNCGRVPGGGWYAHHRLGGNHRLTALQAALLRAGLRRLPEQIRARTAAAEALTRLLGDIAGIRLPAADPRVTANAYHLYPFGYDAAEFGGRPVGELVAALTRAGIPASRGYPVPLYRQPVFAAARFDHVATGWTAADPATDYARLNLPSTERACATTVWFPQSVLLAPAERMAEIAGAIRAFQRSA